MTASRADRLLLAPSPDKKTRVCLRCRRSFMSDHVGHRTCAPCHVATQGNGLGDHGVEGGLLTYSEGVWK